MPKRSISNLLKKRYFPLVLIVIVAMVFLEMVAGFLNKNIKFTHGHVSFGVGGGDVFEMPGRYLKDRDLFWRLMPEHNGNNSLGLRDREFSLRTANNITRIICVGDSTTLANAVHSSGETYPKVLEKILNSHSRDEKVEVLNAGVPGYTSYQGLIFLQKKLIKYRPDLLIVYFGANDWGGSNKPDKHQPKLSAWCIQLANGLQGFQFYQLLNNISLTLLYPSNLKRLSLPTRFPGRL